MCDALALTLPIFMLPVLAFGKRATLQLADVEFLILFFYNLYALGILKPKQVQKWLQNMHLQNRKQGRYKESGIPITEVSWILTSDSMIALLLRGVWKQPQPAPQPIAPPATADHPPRSPSPISPASSWSSAKNAFVQARSEFSPDPRLSSPEEVISPELETVMDEFAEDLDMNELLDD